jgi:hypothetical protein
MCPPDLSRIKHRIPNPGAVSSRGHLYSASVAATSLNIEPSLKVRPQIKHTAGLFLLIFCFCLFACGKQSAHLKWEDTSDNEEGFRIYRITPNDTTKIAEVGPNVTNYIDQDALPRACYAVSAFNSAGQSSPSNTACLPD